MLSGKITASTLLAVLAGVSIASGGVLDGVDTQQPSLEEHQTVYMRACERKLESLSLSHGVNQKFGCHCVGTNLAMHYAASGFPVDMMAVRQSLLDGMGGLQIHAQTVLKACGFMPIS